MEISIPEHFYLKSLISFSKTVHLTTLLKEAPLALRISPMLVSAWRASAFTSYKQSPYTNSNNTEFQQSNFYFNQNYTNIPGVHKQPKCNPFEKENIFSDGRVTLNMIVHKFRHHFRIQS